MRLDNLNTISLHFKVGRTQNEKVLLLKKYCYKTGFSKEFEGGTKLIVTVCLNHNEPMSIMRTKGNNAIKHYAVLALKVQVYLLCDVISLNVVITAYH